MQSDSRRECLFRFCAFVFMTGSMLGNQEIRSQETPPTRYQADNGALARVRGEYFFNRPLYGANLPAAALAGDRPLIKQVHTPFICGDFFVAYVRDETARWFHDFSDITAAYHPGRMIWQMRDASFPDVRLRYEAVCVAEGGGMAVRLEIEGFKPDDRLIWAYGGATRPETDLTMWEVDVETHPALLNAGFQPNGCAGDRIELVSLGPDVVDSAFRLGTRDPKQDNRFLWIAAGRCSVATKLGIGDADQFEDALKLVSSTAGDRPILHGEIQLDSADLPIGWLVRSMPAESEALQEWLADPLAAFEQGIGRVQQIGRQVQVDTPDERLNTAVPMLSIAIDGAWYPPVYVHGAMSWNIPFPGWRTLYGPTTFGWYGHVRKQGEHYFAAQIKESDRNQCKAAPEFGFALQAGDSRLHGIGRIDRDQHFYNFQEVFFDQMIHAWRWSGDEVFAKQLRPALELHLEYMRDCFDPDGNGVYESYINVWASDSVWYSGNETTQSTAYAYTGHRAAAQLAEQAGDTAAAKRHRERAEKIRKNMMESLWISEKGYLAEYREHTGYERRHDDACLYTIFLPIDSQMLNPFEAAQALHYTEWGLERAPRSAGGEMCWQSNWVPYVWSVRELAIVESCHLALAYYQAGLGQSAWKLVEGSFAESMLNSKVPGGVQLTGGGTDFNGSTSMLARVIVEGLFGVRFDRPNDVVHVRPQFPEAWPNASIQTPDFELSFERTGEDESYELKLTKACPMKFQLPIWTEDLGEVELNGAAVEYELSPGFGCTWLVIESKSLLSEAQVTIENRVQRRNAAPVHIEGEPGDELKSKLPPDLEVVEWRDPQGILNQKDDHITLAKSEGHHLVFAKVARPNGLDYWQLLKLHVRDPEAEAERRARFVDKVPADAGWHQVDMTEQLNGDVTTIYQQEYRSPRPQTCSVQIGLDSYRPWTFYPWNMKPPTITLSNTDDLVNKNSLLETPQGVPFEWPSGGKNIAFTAFWDNWPNTISVPVNQQGKAAWFLVAGSSNVMQTGIANGVLRLVYSDGSTDSLDLVHPDNYWSLSGTYDYARNGFCLPETPPPAVQLGESCRAMVLNLRLRPNVVLERVELETLSQEVVIGLIGVTLMN